MKNSSLSSLGAVLALATMSAASPVGLGVGAPSTHISQPAQSTKKRDARNAAAFLKAARGGYPNGPGWSQAKVQRMAHKKRNVSTNRRNHRG